MTASLTGPAVLKVILLNQKSDQSTVPVKTNQWLIIILRLQLELPSAPDPGHRHLLSPATQLFTLVCLATCCALVPTPYLHRERTPPTPPPPVNAPSSPRKQ